MDNVTEMLDRALDGFGRRVKSVTDSQWAQSSTCPPWSVRDLVNHVVETLRWTPWLVSGGSVEEGGPRFAGDLLGDDPVTAWEDAQLRVSEAVSAADLGTKIATPYGELTAAEFLALVTAELCVHTWDLARSIGGEEGLDPDLVQEVTSRYLNDRLYNGRPPAESWPTLFGPPVAVAPDADPQRRLLALVGRDPEGQPGSSLAS
jgi:uncharacterized protein (TIGR03086 family)